MNKQPKKISWQTEKRKISDLIPHETNPRTISKKQVDDLTKSLKKFDLAEIPAINLDNTILAGHQRLKVLELLGRGEEEIDVRVPNRQLTEKEAKEYLIRSNKNTGDWDWDVLADQFDREDLGDWGFEDNDFFGNGYSAIEELEGGDDAPSETGKPVLTVLGDIYELGNHRLLCGDSTSVEAVEKLMDGKKADILFTDPPYGIDFSPQLGTHGKILNDALGGVEFDNFLDSAFCAAFACMKPDTYAFVWTGWPKIGAFERSLQKFFRIQAMHIWVKNNFGIGYYSRPKHEPFYLCLNGKPVYPANAPADVWEAKKVHKTVHSCEKPVDLIVDILDTYHKNSTVLDLFGGSGTTLIACEKTNRKARLMELDPKYCDVIVRRYVAFCKKNDKPFSVIRNGEPCKDFDDSTFIDKTPEEAVDA